MAETLTLKDFLNIGLLLVGFDEKQRSKNCFEQLVTWFRTAYGEHPLVYAILWFELRNIDQHRDLKYFFMCLNWFKTYALEGELAGRFNLNDKTCRKWCLYYAKKIGNLFDVFIVFPTEEEMDDEILLGVVDGVHTQSYEPRMQHPDFPFDKGMNSHKFNKAGFAWEIVLNMVGKPIWVNGPFPAGQNDIKIFNEKGLKDKIPDGKYIFGDLGYQGANGIITANQYELYECKAFKRKHRARIEHYNSRLKKFGILNQRFRQKGDSRFEKQTIVFQAINVIVCIALDNGFPLFDP